MQKQLKVFFFIFLYFISFGQVPKFLNSAGDTLNLSLIGGLNAPQFSNIDLDNDGIKDLFIFDRADNSVLPVLIKPSGNVIHYIYAPEYASAFFDLHDWVLLADYDCDGKEDLFTARSSYIQVRRNTGSGGNLSFSVTYDTLTSEYFGGTITYLYSSFLDIPGLVDVDFDGDLDILVWDLLSGSRIEFHKNLSVEQTGQCGQMLMKKQSSCFGHFTEYYDYNKNSYTAILNEPPCGAGQKFFLDGERVMHSGGTILGINLNGDTLMDVVISDNGPTDFIGLTNGGSRAIAHFIDADTLFPRTSIEADLYYFPASYYVDVDADGKKDLVIASNEPLASNFKNIWLYKNNGVNQAPIFAFQKNNFLGEQMLDVGRNSAPAFFDYEGDGDWDLLLASDVGIDDQGNEQIGIRLLENIGNNSQPIFKVVTEDLLQFQNYALTQNLKAVVPTLGDLDGDGDADLLFGNQDGTLWYYKNVAPSNSPAIFAYQTDNFEGIDVGDNSAPTLYDLDGDGDLDLFIGDKTGKIHAYENKGAGNGFGLIDNNWGNVQVTSTQNPYIGYAYPHFADINNDGQSELLVGNINGDIEVFSTPVLQAGQTFLSLGKLKSGQIKAGAYSKIATYSTGDTLRLFLGNLRGGLMYFEHKLLPTEVTSSLGENGIMIYPNPAKEFIIIKNAEGLEFILYNYMGKVVKTGKIISSRARFSLENFTSGIYFLQFKPTQGDGKNNYKRLIIIK